MTTVVNNSFTLLELSGIGVPPYSVRGITQSLQPIAQATVLKRNVNGGLVDISFDGFQKYSSSISASDMTPPAVDGNWPGKVVEVSCVTELLYPVGGSPSRPVVPGSQRTEGGFVHYRPILTMMVVGWSYQDDEYGEIVSWSMQLEEV